MDYSVTNNARSMKDIRIGDIYQVPRPWSAKIVEGNMLVRVVGVKKYFAICEPVLYPSAYGMSIPYFIDFVPDELREEHRVKSYEEVREWIRSCPHYMDCPEVREELVKVKEDFERRNHIV